MVDWPALYRPDLKEPGYKVAWIETPPTPAVCRSACCFFYSRISRLARPHPGHVLVAISNKQPAGALELAKPERRAEAAPAPDPRAGTR
jgi:hypothetical protein